MANSDKRTEWVDQCSTSTVFNRPYPHVNSTVRGDVGQNRSPTKMGLGQVEGPLRTERAPDRSITYEKERCFERNRTKNQLDVLAWFELLPVNSRRKRPR